LVVEYEGRLSCRKCSGITSLEEADKFAEIPCSANKQQIASQPEQEIGRPSKQSCDICRAGEGREKTPILDPTTGQINQKLLCGNCFKDYLRILRFSGPRFGRVKARAPPNGVWFSYGENNKHTLHTDKRVVALPSMRRVLRKPIRRYNTLRNETHRDS
jgi:hypothetical protein